MSTSCAIPAPFETIVEQFTNGKMMRLRQISYPVAKVNSRCGIFS
jgi:hypothetical protein